MTRQHADVEHGGRTGGHARNEHSQHAQVHQHHTSSHALPHPRAHNPCCKCAHTDNTACRAARLTGDLRTSGRTARSP
eukprot:333971-Prymnesium_polylepis.1